MIKSIVDHESCKEFDKSVLYHACSLYINLKKDNLIDDKCSDHVSSGACIYLAWAHVSDADSEYPTFHSKSREIGKLATDIFLNRIKCDIRKYITSPPLLDFVYKISGKIPSCDSRWDYIFINSYHVKNMKTLFVGYLLLERKKKMKNSIRKNIYIKIFDISNVIYKHLLSKGIYDIKLCTIMFNISKFLRNRKL